MVPFNQFIREARIALGFQAAKEFHRAKSDILSMSYESYSNIEAGKYLPPADKLTALAQSLEVADLKGFIFAYCHNLMPNDIFKSFFSQPDSNPSALVLKTDPFQSYKEKFHALMQFNQLQSKYELSPEQLVYLETDLVSWDIINLYISSDNEGFSFEEIALRTRSDLESTKKRVGRLVELQMLKLLDTGKFLVTQDAFIIPRRPVANKLTHQLVRRELENSYADSRNKPYTRFRFMSIDPADRDQIEMFIDNFILDSRKFRKDDGKTHYFHVLFSDRNDL